MFVRPCSYIAVGFMGGFIDHPYMAKGKREEGLTRGASVEGETLGESGAHNFYFWHCIEVSPRLRN